MHCIGTVTENSVPLILLEDYERVPFLRHRPFPERMASVQSDSEKWNAETTYCPYT